MLELLAMYQAMPPLVVGIILLAVGLAVGSFSSVLLERIPRRQSIAGPRSHCPACGHTLGARELIPVLSFLWQRGKCRWCGGAIPWRYPLLELGCGVTTGAVGVAAGWLAGLAVVVVWILGASAGGYVRQAEAPGSDDQQSGITLVEVLVALLLISIALLPALETIKVARNAGRAGQRRSAAVGLARARLAELSQLGWADPTTLDTLNGTATTKQIQSADLLYDTYRIQVSSVSGSGAVRTVEVTVTCPDCAARYGQPIPPITLSTTVRKETDTP